jgi:AraC-like DNA-binding protein
MSIKIINGSDFWQASHDWRAGVSSVAVIMLSGAGVIERPGRRDEILACQFWLFSADLAVALRFEDACAVIFAVPELDTLALEREQPVVIDSTSAGILDDVFFANQRSLAHQHAALTLVCHQLAAMAGIAVPVEPATDSGADTGLVARATEYMTAHLDEPITLDQLAEHCGCSKAHLIAQFKRQQNMTPIKVLAEMRIARARVYLEEGELTISQIAHAVGYRDLASFSHFFKRQTGQSPSELRDNARWLV